MMNKRRMVLLSVAIVVGAAVFADVFLIMNFLKLRINNLAVNTGVGSPSKLFPDIKPSDNTIKTDSLPIYTGQAVTDIGNDPIIGLVPAVSLEKNKQFLAAAAETLRKNPKDFDAWISVGIYKKFFNNYIGAKDAWEYAKLVAPQQPKSYLNLAPLYGYYLKDQKKAEYNFLKAIELDPLNAFGARYALANFYRDMGMKNEAIEYFKKVLELEPNNQPVKVELERLNQS